MKHFKIFTPLIAAALILEGCATQDVQKYLGSPDQVQADITYLGGRAKQYVSPDNQAKLHQIGVQIGQLSNADISGILALIPTPSGTTEALLVSTLKATLQLVVSLYAHNNGTLLSYFHAISVGILANY